MAIDAEIVQMPNKFRVGDAVERVTAATLSSGEVGQGQVGRVCRKISPVSYAVFFNGMPRCVMQMESSLRASTKASPTCPPGTPGC